MPEDNENHEEKKEKQLSIQRDGLRAVFMAQLMGSFQKALKSVHKFFELTPHFSFLFAPTSLKRAWKICFARAFLVRYILMPLSQMSDTHLRNTVETIQTGNPLCRLPWTSGQSSPFVDP